MKVVPITRSTTNMKAHATNVKAHATNLVTPRDSGKKITVRKRVSIPLALKHTIVNEAYSSSRSIRHTARKYQIQPIQISNWKKSIDELRSSTEGLHDPSEVYSAKLLKDLLAKKEYQ